MCFKYCYRGSKTNVLCINNKETAVMFLSILTAPPSAPTITSLISTSSDRLTVTWTSVPTATSYNVSINDSANTLVSIPSTGAPQYTITGLTNNTVYSVSVVAINCAGSSGAIASNSTGRCEFKFNFNKHISVFKAYHGNGKLHFHPYCINIAVLQDSYSLLHALYK